MDKLFSIIVAMDENNAIGKDNQLPWHLSNDLKRFKQITLGHTVIMGNKTFQSLPKGPLPDRVNIVLTSQQGIHIDHCLVLHSLEEVFFHCDEHRENFIIGGASIYKQFLPFVQKLYMTRVHATFQADTFFPDLDPNAWDILQSEDHNPDDKNPYPYSFITCQRH